MQIPDTYKLNFQPLDLEVVEVLDFQNFPVLTVEKNPTGFKYLSWLYQFGPDGVEQRFVVPLTEARLDALKSGAISPREAFSESELEQVYCILYDEASGEVKETWLLPLPVFRNINPIPFDYQIAAVALP